MALALRLPPSPARPLLRKLILAGLCAADPHRGLLHIVSRRGQLLRIGRHVYDLSRYERLVVVGAGKASARMAQSLESILGSRIEGGLVVVKTGHRAPLRRITVVEAAHPIPDRAGLRAAERIKALVGDLTSHDLLIVLLSGGASSLLPAPVPGLTLADKRRTTDLLLRSGASINEVNAVRKHLSQLKGGGLARSTKATIVTLVLSDVIGDDFGTIGSGPTAPDPTTFADAIDVLKRYKIWRAAPPAVRRHLLQGLKGTVPETLKPGASRLRRVRHLIIGNNRTMIEAVARAAKRAGIHVRLLSTPVTGEARREAERFVRTGKRLLSGSGGFRRPICLIAGGEPTVTVTGQGKGGRAQEFATAAAFHLQTIPKAWLAAVGSDGTDGPTDAAGAVVTEGTVARARSLGVDLLSALNRHDTYHALHTLGCHIRTGPTGTNVNDLYLLLLL
ncbi:MAG: glycerate kinase [Nitrospira sp.]|nr:glycerate kinase [Nitrospira sp.]MCP9441956.1 glycerate kinase [Nitrospira sp.]